MAAAQKGVAVGIWQERLLRQVFPPLPGKHQARYAQGVAGFASAIQYSAYDSTERSTHSFLIDKDGLVKPARR